MEDISANVLPLPDQNNDNNRRSNTRYIPTQGFSDRVARALRNRLLLLYRSDPNFYVLGATGNVYVVNLTMTLKCSCPDRATPCKHILFVLIRVLGVALDDPRLRRRTLRPYQLAHLMASPTSAESLAGPTLRERFQEAFLARRELGGAGHEPCTEVEEGATCPICLEEMTKEGSSSSEGGRGRQRLRLRLVACGTCRNWLHEECLLTWKRSQRRRSVSCVMCRSRWRVRAEQERYLNLAAYVSEDDVAHANGGGIACAE